MNTLFTRAILVFIMFFGITGGGYALTESSLPDSPFYAAKLALEKTQLQMKSDPASAASQHLIMVQHRIQEIVRLAQAGKEFDERAMTSLENHLNATFQLAAQMGDDEMLGVLTQAKIMLQEQIQQMTQTQAHVSSAAQAQLQLVIQLLTQAQNQADLGLQDPDAFRLQFGNTPPPEQPVPGGPNGDQNCPNCPCVDCDDDQDQDLDLDEDDDQDDDQDEDDDLDEDDDEDEDDDDDDDEDDEDEDQDEDLDHDQDHD